MNYIFFLCFIFILCSCQSEEKKLILISIDGYRWDYTDRYNPPFLSSFKNQAATLEYLIPSYPTKTFPNHLSIATGSYPMNHGIISNHFYAPDLQKTYSLKNRQSVENGDFYQAMPIWGLLEQNNIKTATYFWPGSEAIIKNTKPSIFKIYDQTIPNTDRTKQALTWLARRDKDAPRLITLYFSDVDFAGHRFGPDSLELQAAIKKVDSELEDFITKARKQQKNLDIIIVSDHGMQGLVPQNVELLLKKENNYLSSLYYTYGDGPIIHLYKKENIITKINADIKLLNEHSSHFKCYSPLNTPKLLHFHQNPRMGDIVCIADNLWNISISETKKFNPGNHGWSQFETTDMNAIFYASGPSFKEKYLHKAVENIHIFPLIAKIFNVQIRESIDGEFAKIKDLLK